MYKKGAGNDKQGKDAGNRTLCPYSNFSQAIIAVTGVMHEADDAYSIRSIWSCYWLDQFLTLALNTLILSIFLYFTGFVYHLFCSF